MFRRIGTVEYSENTISQASPYGFATYTQNNDIKVGKEEENPQGWGGTQERVMGDAIEICL